MSKRTVFTSITPLPPDVPRHLALALLHDHLFMIDLNPLVISRRPIPPPKHALPEEHICAWYAITDKISYLPGGLVTGAVEYTAAFHDLPMGMQTHCLAPMGVDLREKWTVGGILPGEPPEPAELGLGAPSEGLYLREDVDLRCSIVMAGFVKKTLKRAHEEAVRRLVESARERLAGERERRRREGEREMEEIVRPRRRVEMVERPLSWAPGAPDELRVYRADAGGQMGMANGSLF